MLQIDVDSQNLLYESSENEDEQDEYPVVAASINAGATLQTPKKAAIARKRKLPVNDHKYNQRNSKTTVDVKTSACDRLKDFPNHHFAVVNQKLR